MTFKINGSVVIDNNVNITTTGSITSSTFTGNGALLTSLDAGKIIAGNLPTTIFPTTGVVAGQYVNPSSVVVDAYGRITGASNCNCNCNCPFNCNCQCQC